MDEKGHMATHEELLVEEKAKNILENYGFKGDFIKICKNAYNLG